MTATGSEPSLPQGTHPLHVVLYQPEIPPNTGNIGRTCVALGAKLWIVRPAGFRLDSAQIKRSGMDYWNDLDWEMVDSWDHLLQRLPSDRMWLVTKFGTQAHCDASYRWGDVLVFGRESSGLPQALHEQYAARQVMIPMPGPVRCLNLATSAGIVLYEAARQIGLLHAPADPGAS
ncbi:MAG: tRNA (cytidine(34)-2'-O)-methyltransferase [Planctomycetales bacterium]|nr:tRNA (cytidine(34)-2'-O)-methyltransferase [Planctomycetales bacterium]